MAEPRNHSQPWRGRLQNRMQNSHSAVWPTDSASLTPLLRHLPQGLCQDQMTLKPPKLSEKSSFESLALWKGEEFRPHLWKEIYALTVARQPRCTPQPPRDHTPSAYSFRHLPDRGSNPTHLGGVLQSTHALRSESPRPVADTFYSGSTSIQSVPFSTRETSSLLSFV